MKSELPDSQHSENMVATAGLGSVVRDIVSGASRYVTCLAVLCFSLPGICQAEPGGNLDSRLRLPGLFSPGAVLQRGTKVPVWGWGKVGETVSVRFGDQTAETLVAEDGTWKVTFDELKPGLPRVLEVSSGKEEVKVPDILVGEVWFCSGQSNMLWRMREYEEDRIHAGRMNEPTLRVLQLSSNLLTAGEPDLELGGHSWQVATDGGVLACSAVATYFGEALQAALDVPVGIIVGAFGGAPAESWIDERTLRSDPGFAEVFGSWQRLLDSRPILQKRHERAMADWKQKSLAADEAGITPPPQPRLHSGLQDKWKPGSCYRSFLEPVMPYAIRGILWYQGESNSSRPVPYEDLLGGLVRSWRTGWQNADLPFVVVQLPSHEAATGEDWGRVRHGQKLASERLSGITLVSTLDLGEKSNIHPAKKDLVGRRAARAARARVYGQDLVAGGPLYRGMERSPDKILLRFENVGLGLMTLDNEAPRHFEILDAEGTAYPTRAALVADGVAVYFPQTKAEPVQVRYGWSNFVESPNLVNSSQLPAATFRADIGIR